MEKKITVHKLDEQIPITEKKTVGAKLPLKSILKKTIKNSKLNLKGVRDPALSKKHTIRILTSKGHRRRDKTLKKQISKIDDKKVSELTRKSGLVKNPNMPANLQRQILNHAISAGFVSL
jgi:hypothetical protein